MIIVKESSEAGEKVIVKKTIYQALAEKLQREPSNEELKAEVKRILEEGLVEMAEKGKLPHQRKRR